jgi:multicomponent Na+:H+ antiporter subunit D
VSALLVMPILIPLLAAATAFLLHGSRRAQRAFGLAGTVALLFAGLGLFRLVWQEGIQAAQMGRWPAPFGITLVADLFSAIMVVITGVIAVAVGIYSLSSQPEAHETFSYYPMFNVLLMGVCGAFLTGDLFNLYVWFEVMLIASFVLLALGGGRKQVRGALKYVTMNLISSAFFLSAVGILYGVTGTLNMADLSEKLGQIQNDALLAGVAMMFLVTFGVKAAIFPLFFWLPASYHTPPSAVSALFAGLLTKVGVYAMIRVFTLLFVQEPGFTHTLILVLSGLTMITGVLGAIAQNEFRRILSFHIISQIGYMILGLGLFTVAGLAGSIFYIVHHILVKTNLFLVSGIVHRLRGSYELDSLGGLYAKHPWVSLLFLIPAFSLAGLPPLSGFFAKFALAKAGLEQGQFGIIAVALLVGLLTLYSMTKIWTVAFWKPLPDEQRTGGEGGLSAGMIGPVIGLATLTVAMGAAAGPLLAVSLRAAEQLLNPGAYVEAVLGGGRQ